MHYYRSLFPLSELELKAPLTRDERKHAALGRFAQSIAALSVCKRKKVGCIVFDEAFTQVFSMGYNGPPAKIAHEYCSGESRACGCIHAEANALLKLQTSRKDLILLSTTSPCHYCAGLIINHPAVAEVQFIIPWSDSTPVDLLRAAKTPTYKVLPYLIPEDPNA